MALTSSLTLKTLKTLTLKSLSLNFLHNLNFSTSVPTPPPTPTPTPETDASKKPKRKKKKTLFEVAQFLPNWGVGFHLAKSHWTDVSYEITKINLYKSGKHGKAWGLAYIKGRPAYAAKKISGVNKRGWKYIANPIKLEAPKPETPEPEAPEPEAAQEA